MSVFEWTHEGLRFYGILSMQDSSYIIPKIV